MQRLKPLLEAAQVSAYLAGHDHCAQHLDEGLGVQYHGVGAGILCASSTSHINAVPNGSLKWHYDAGLFGILDGAYAHVHVNETGLTVEHFKSNGDLMYSAVPILPRRKRLK